MRLLVALKQSFSLVKRYPTYFLFTAKCIPAEICYNFIGNNTIQLITCRHISLLYRFCHIEPDVGPILQIFHTLPVYNMPLSVTLVRILLQYLILENQNDRQQHIL